MAQGVGTVTGRLQGATEENREEGQEEVVD
jgi:hypothetical protein